METLNKRTKQTKRRNSNCNWMRKHRLQLWNLVIFVKSKKQLTLFNKQRVRAYVCFYLVLVYCSLYTCFDVHIYKNIIDHILHTEKKKKKKKDKCDAWYVYFFGFVCAHTICESTYIGCVTERMNEEFNPYLCCCCS